MELLKGFKSSPSPENTRAIPGAVFHFLAMGNETNGNQSLIKITVQRGAEPPAHTHSREDESYFILAGSITYTIGEECHHRKRRRIRLPSKKCTPQVSNSFRKSGSSHVD